MRTHQIISQRFVTENRSIKAPFCHRKVQIEKLISQKQEDDSDGPQFDFSELDRA